MSNRNGIRLGSAALVLAVAAAPATAAPALTAESAAPAPTAPVELALLDQSEMRETIVVTARIRETETLSATRTDTPLRDVPQAISVIDSWDIESRALRSIGDLLRFVPGAQAAQGEGNRDQIVLRGNQTTADFFIDGLRDDVQYYRDFYNIERVEVLKGPNAMIFGRGGGGGVVNRVVKFATPDRHLTAAAETGTHEEARVTADVGGEVAQGVSARLNALYENSGSYRDFVDLERWGLNPTLSIDGDRTRFHLGYEHFEDRRTADRGVPSQNGRPFLTSRGQFFGNPDLSRSRANVELISADLSHDLSDSLTLHAQALYGDYDKFYENVYAGGPVSPAGTLTIAAYDNATQRKNAIARTDLVWTGGGHTLLVGAEIARQESSNARFDGVNQTVSAANPVTRTPVLFNIPVSRNTGVADIAGIYIQDQFEVTPWLQLIGGLRFDSFRLDFTNLRTGAGFVAKDSMVSPRAGVVLKPGSGDVSLYGSYSQSFLPQSGDQFSTLDLTLAALEPEKFENFEAGVKWQPTSRLLVSAAVYRLDRTNTRAAGPTPGTTVLTGKQRSSGVELEVNGQITKAWRLSGGVALQDAEIRSTTTAAPAGRKVALVPKRSLSLWSSHDIGEKVNVGLGLVAQSKRFATVSNAVTLPGYARVDAALSYAPLDWLVLRANIENLFNRRYWATAHNDNNITPGAPTSARVSATVRF